MGLGVAVGACVGVGGGGVATAVGVASISVRGRNLPSWQALILDMSLLTFNFFAGDLPVACFRSLLIVGGKRCRRNFPPDFLSKTGAFDNDDMEQ